MIQHHLQERLSSLKEQESTLQDRIQRQMKTLNEGISHAARIRIESELKNLNRQQEQLLEQIEEIEYRINNVNLSGEMPLRDRELDYLKAIVEEYEPLASQMYTDVSMTGKSQRRNVKVKPGVERYLKMQMHHEIFSTISHSIDDDDSRSFTIASFQELLEIIYDSKQVALIGEPGSGKTTTLQRISYELAVQAIGDPVAPLPVLVRLGNYSNQNIDEFFEQFFDHLDLTSYLPNRIFLLLDGLNEMPVEQVNQVEEWLRSNHSVSTVVTCRKLDYIERKLPLRRIDVLPFDVKQIYTFIGNFFEDSDRDRLFWALSGNDTRSSWEWFRREYGFRATFEEFWFGKIERAFTWEVEKYHLKTVQDSLRERGELPGILGLVTNPFLLFTVSIIYMHNDEPPQNRGQLFEQFTELLFEKRGKLSATQEHPWISASIQHDVLASVGHRMLMEQRGTEVSKTWVLQILSEEFPDNNPETLVHLATGAGILELRVTGTDTTVRFSHQLLQEYFAALQMADDVGRVSAEKYWPNERWWEPTGWEETVLLLAGVQRDATSVVKWLTPVNPTLAYQCATESGAKCDKSVMQALYNPPPQARSSPYARAEWGRILAAEGDFRPGVNLDSNELPDILWCRVPAGEFLMGGGEELLRTLGLSWGTREVLLEYPYFVSKYPITYAQFSAFIKDGYENRTYWTTAGWKWKGSQSRPRLWDNPAFHFSNHPVVGVTWYESYAFTRWLDDSLHKNEFMPPDPEFIDWEISLPLEAEWEKAARFPDNRKYPWGNEYSPGNANIDETFQDAECGPHFLRRATAVGMYELGKSYLDIYDMCGNIWEWMLSKWDVEYKYPEEINPEGTEHRGIRGGSWYNSVQFAHSAAHDCLDPDLGVSDVGFRIVLRPRNVSSNTIRDTGETSTSTLKVFLAGLPKVGKTEFIKSISDFPPISVQKKIVGTDEQVDMDYGRAHISGKMVYLYAPVSDTRYTYIWDSLYEEVHALIFFVDSTDSDSLEESRVLYKSLIESKPCPHIITVTKGDQASTDNLQVLNIDSSWDGQVLVPCIATSKPSARKVIKTLLQVLAQ